MSKKLTTEEFIEKAREVHGDKYDYSKVEYVNTHVKVCIICPKHGEFWQTPHDHLKSECKECYNEKRGDLSRSNAEEFIKKAKLIHGDKYDYSKVNYLNNRTNVIIICPIHGEFTQTPNTHLNGSGCYQCNKHNGGVKQKFNKDFFIEKSKKIHNNKYDYSKVNYKNINKKVCIICPIHGEFTQTPYNHLKGSGCPLCARNKRNRIIFFISST